LDTQHKILIIIHPAKIDFDECTADKIISSTSRRNYNIQMISKKVKTFPPKLEDCLPFIKNQAHLKLYQQEPP
jgi:hypothetical protein